MRDLKLVSLSEDGSHLVLTHDGTGEQFALAIDDRIRSAVVSDRARVGQLPLEVESRLRPKEIQARVRAGEHSEVIAAAANVSIERVLRYAGPVLAEREHVAGLARRCAVRRHGHEGPGAILHQMVESRLNSSGFSTETLAWDAWRNTGSSWTIAAQYTAAGDTRTATFDFDPVSRIVVPADDRARLLTGEQSVDEVPPEFEQREPARANRGTDRTGQRARLSAVPNPEAEPAAQPEHTEHTEPAAQAPRSADTAVNPGNPGSPGDSEETVDLTGVRRRAFGLDQPGPQPAGTLPQLGPDEVAELDHPDEPADPTTETAADPAAPDTAGSERSSGADAGDPAAAEAAEAAGDADEVSAAAGSGAAARADQPVAARRPQSQRKRRSKRAVVPSWDEILFGAADGNAE